MEIIGRTPLTYACTSDNDTVLRPSRTSFISNRINYVVAYIDIGRKKNKVVTRLIRLPAVERYRHPGLEVFNFDRWYWTL